MKISGSAGYLVVFIIAAAAAVSWQLFSVVILFIMVIVCSKVWPRLKQYLLKGHRKDMQVELALRPATSASVKELRVNIYELPTVLQQKADIITLGDLHGNTVKLIHGLFLYNVVTFKDEVPDQAAAYRAFVTAYEQLGEAAYAHLDFTAGVPVHRATARRLQAVLNRLDALQKKGEGALSASEREWAATRDRGDTLVSLRAALGRVGRLTERLSALVRQVPGQLRTFREFLDQLQVGRRVSLVRLIGDEMSDRGSNDYLTLRVLDWLRTQRVPLRIMISNHSQDFVSTFEHCLNAKRCCSRGLRVADFAPQGMITFMQKLSLIGLHMLITLQLVPLEEVTRLFVETYAPLLRVLDYSVCQDGGVRLYTHAPVAFRTVKLIARRLKVSYDDRSVQALAGTIQRINAAFTQGVRAHTTHKWCNSEEYNVGGDASKLAEKWPLVDIIWNRWNALKDLTKINLRPASVNGYAVQYVHGHDTFQSPHAHVANLDTCCGKASQAKQRERVAQFSKTLADQPNLPARTVAMIREYLDSVNLLKVMEETPC